MSRRSRCESNTARSSEPRCERFDSNQPFAHNPSLSLLGATGAFKHFNPTSAQYSWSGWNPSHDHSSTAEHSHATDHASSDEGRQQHSSGDEGEHKGHFPARLKNAIISFVWRSRDNRKGRHALVLRRGEDGEEQPHGTLEPTNSLRATLRGSFALFTKFPYWDISWCVAIVYTVGSIVWVVNGFTILLPKVGKGSSEDLKPVKTWTAFTGASIFFLGSYLLFLEAVNANRIGCFGWAVERTLKGIRPEVEVHPGTCEHHYHAKDDDHHTHKAHKDENVGVNAQGFSDRDDGHDEATANGWPRSGSQADSLTAKDEEAAPPHSYKWLWWPSWRDLRTHFLHEIGFLACAIQLVSGALFWLSKFATLPGITDHISQPVIDCVNWAPQMVGCIGFIVASLLFLLETQQEWYLPAPSVLGWHVGVWKLIGCVGFLLSAVLGVLGQHGVQFAEKQSNIASFWGSWMILLGSLMQWYESLDKYPIVEEGISRYSEWNESFVNEREE